MSGLSTCSAKAFFHILKTSLFLWIETMELPHSYSNGVQTLIVVIMAKSSLFFQGHTAHDKELTNKIGPFSNCLIADESISFDTMHLYSNNLLHKRWLVFCLFSMRGTIGLFSDLSHLLLCCQCL